MELFRKKFAIKKNMNSMFIEILTNFFMRDVDNYRDTSMNI